MSEEEEQAPVVSEAEQKARAGNWAPEEEWHGHKDDWIDYKEFNFRGELMDRIKEQSSIINNLKGQVDTGTKVIGDLKTHQDGIAEREYNKALKSLKIQKAQAVDDGDGALVVAIDEEMDGIKEQVKAQKVVEVPVVQGTPPEITTWLEDPSNSWYATNPILRSVADGVAQKLLGDNPNMTPTQMLQQMNVDVRKEMPGHFKSATPSVDDGGGDAHVGGGGGKGKKFSYGDLDQDQQDVCRRFETLGVMTRQEYIDDLASMGEL